MTALLAPEFVVYIAWRQRDPAKQALRKLRIHYGEGEPEIWREKGYRFRDYFRSSADEETEDEESYGKFPTIRLVSA